MRPRTTDTCPLHAGQRSDGPLFLGGCCAAAACGCGVRFDILGGGSGLVFCVTFDIMYSMVNMVDFRGVRLVLLEHAVLVTVGGLA